MGTFAALPYRGGGHSTAKVHEQGEKRKDADTAEKKNEVFVTGGLFYLFIQTGPQADTSHQQAKQDEVYPDVHVLVSQIIKM